MTWRPFSGQVVVGGVVRGTRGGFGTGRDFGMGVYLAVPLTKWRIPNGGGFLKKGVPKGGMEWVVGHPCRVWRQALLSGIGGAD